METATLDTYEVPVLVEMESEDTLAGFRQQVKQEIAEKSERGKFSDAALQKLRLIREQDKVQEVMDARSTAALKCIVITPGILSKLLTRCNTSVPVTQLDRRVAKLNFWITAGYSLGEEINSVTLLNFFSELTAEEQVMSDGKFFGLWNLIAAEKRRASRQSRGLINSEPVFKPCKADKKCLQYEKRRPAPARGSGDYCSTGCAASDRVRAKRALAATPTIQ
jgi:hypothetical protein